MALERRPLVIDPPNHGGGGLFKLHAALDRNWKAASRQPLALFVCSGDTLPL